MIYFTKNISDNYYYYIIIIAILFYILTKLQASILISIMIVIVIAYYIDYNKSYYGVTMKKAGWDCMRHYEILANHCVPYFIDLESCPKQTLTNLPKELLIEARELSLNFDQSKYDIILNELFNYTRKNLTTKKLAEYLLSKI